MRPVPSELKFHYKLNQLAPSLGVAWENLVTVFTQID